MQQTSLSSCGDWVLERLLGSGGFGEVLKWRNRRTDQEIATKCLKKNPSLSEDEVCKLKQRYQQEYEYVTKLQTPYIVHGVDVQDADFQQYLLERNAFPLPVITMEYCNGGDLRHHLQRPENLNGLCEYEVRQVLLALRHAVEYMHDRCGIEHRDLKPDNVVMHRNGSHCSYKLTDFGFARHISDNTILKSVVGTRHYFAPEVVDTAQYTKTVDYWSLGVIAFELLCCVLPFIPHQDMFHIITNIKEKPADCIAITEDVQERKMFHFQRKVFAEHRASDTFVAKMEPWLRLALDKSYKTRGTVPALAAPPPVSAAPGVMPRPSSARELKFYTELDAILQSRVLTMFYLNGYRHLSYELTPDMTLQQLLAVLERDTKLDCRNFFFAFPLGHPRPVLTKETQPVDFYVENWQDTSLDSLNPPVMVYLLGYQCDYNAAECRVPDILKRCMQLQPQAKVPDWLQQQLERETHFLLSTEQRQREMLLDGLKAYALKLDEEVFQFEPIMQTFVEEIVFMNGKVAQFETMIQAGSDSTDGGQLPPSSWQEKCANFNKEMNEIGTNIRSPLQTRYNSVRRRTKEEASSQVLEQLAKSDIYKLQKFRQYLQSHSHDGVAPLAICQNAVLTCLKQRDHFLTNDKQWQRANRVTSDMHSEFQQIKAIVDNTRKHLSGLQQRVEHATKEYMQQLFQRNWNGHADAILAHSMTPQYMLNVDGAVSEPLNLFSDTTALREEAMTCVQQMLNTMDINMEQNGMEHAAS